MTYMGKDGAQYVVIPASGGTSVGGGLPISDQLVAFKLSPAPGKGLRRGGGYGGQGGLARHRLDSARRRQRLAGKCQNRFAEGGGGRQEGRAPGSHHHHAGQGRRVPIR